MSAISIKLCFVLVQSKNGESGMLLAVRPSRQRSKECVIIGDSTRAWNSPRAKEACEQEN